MFLTVESTVLIRSTPKSQVMKNCDTHEDRTPQPEDFGISLASIMSKYKDPEKKESSEQQGPHFKIPHIPHHGNG